MQLPAKILKVTMKQITELVIPTDKFSDWLFDQKKISNVTKMNEGNFKGKEVYSTITFKFGGGLLEPIDKAVLLALISERAAGNEIVSAQRLFETLGGSNHLTEDVKEWLLNSVRKLSDTYVKVNMTELVTAIYKGKKATIEGNLIHANIITAEINKKVTDSAIQLVGDSPVMQVADVKNQIARLPKNALSKVRGSMNQIILSWYLLERVAEIVGSHSSNRKKRVHKLQPVILFDTLCQKCGFVDLDKYDLRRLRDNIRKILEHFKQINLILDYEFTKVNGKIYSIEISVNGVTISTEENQI